MMRFPFDAHFEALAGDYRDALAYAEAGGLNGDGRLEAARRALDAWAEGPWGSPGGPPGSERRGPGRAKRPNGWRRPLRYRSHRKHIEREDVDG